MSGEHEQVFCDCGASEFPCFNDACVSLYGVDVSVRKVCLDFFFAQGFTVQNLDGVNLEKRQVENNPST